MSTSAEACMGIGDDDLGIEFSRPLLNPSMVSLALLWASCSCVKAKAANV